MPNVFPNEWYNGDPYSTSESGYILDYNRLVGGLLIVQKRGGKARTCVQPRFNSTFSSYDGFYPDCYSTVGIEMDRPMEERIGLGEVAPEALFCVFGPCPRIFVRLWGRKCADVIESDCAAKHAHDLCGQAYSA